ncbi:PAS domain-containing sensor histidine kinase [Glaciecola sp. KUL10]|uniref:sensor histidine kinase n=1 Tax=Glaciecola sp. (strain KUL10) TaxID=2161813 RepID=UPI000D78A0C1|nr:ATP-binding protein [Glaciecola sp. KUL10]GBL05503.1 nitrogen regulation protein NtrY [Glaciecola sp. KUL10]
MNLSISKKLPLLTGVVSLVASLPILLLEALSLDLKLFIILCLVTMTIVLTRYLISDITDGLSALETGLLNLKDGEFASTLAFKKGDEIGRLCEIYNETVIHLRDEKHWLYQRELLLDKVTQSSPEVLFLIDDKGQVIFSNISARQFFGQHQGIEGMFIDELVTFAENGAKQAILERATGLFSMTLDDGDVQTWHMSLGQFLLNNQTHHLFILKQMTRELSRQEVAVWKKVIRVISHELNNSLGPISSMLHSGKILSENLSETRLARVFETIDERIVHLTSFVQGYGKFAKLPEPQIKTLNWMHLSEQLAEQWQFQDLSEEDVAFQADPVQIEQLLINLLKNAHESEGKVEDISMSIKQLNQEVCITVTDRGKGISDTVMANALVPFYSTKPSGTGLGLALCREIVDSHHGRIALRNNAQGGLSVIVTLPNLTPVG